MEKLSGLTTVTLEGVALEFETLPYGETSCLICLKTVIDRVSLIVVAGGYGIRFRGCPRLGIMIVKFGFSPSRCL